MITVVLVLIPAVVAALLVTLLLHATLTANLQQRTLQRLGDVVSVVEHEGYRGLATDAGPADPTVRVRVLDAAGRVAYDSNPTEGALATPVPAAGQVVTVGAQPWPQPGDDVPPLVAAGTAAFEGATYIVVVAESQLEQHEAVVTVAMILTATIPVLLLLTAAASWWLVGRTLRPVEALRQGVESIGASSLDQRVPVPTGNDEVSRLAVTMNVMLQRLDDGGRRQRQFVADASHELRSPLASLRAGLQVATRSDTLEEWRALSPVLVAESDRLEALVEDLLTLSKGGEREDRARTDDVDLAKLLTDEAARLRSLGRVDVDLHVAAVRVRGDRAELVRVVRNLADNAARAAASTVDLTLTRDAGQAILTVEDDGAGIPDSERERVFERFVRLDSDRARHGGGSGLGLAIVRQLVEAHGGGVSAQRSTRLGGACFRVSLPAQSQDGPNR